MYDPNGWVLVKLPFTPHLPDSKIELSAQKPELKGKEMYIDELLIKPVATDLYRQNDSLIWHNNYHWIEQKE